MIFFLTGKPSFFIAARIFLIEFLDLRLIELFIEFFELCRYYTTRLWIGTPPQMFALIVDTGSTVTYVPCSTCEQCGRHQVMIRCVFSAFLLDSCVHSLTL